MNKEQIETALEKLLNAIFETKDDTLDNIEYYKSIFDKDDNYKIIIGDLPSNFSPSLIVDSIYATDIDELVTIVKKIK